MKSTQAILQTKDMAIERALYVSFELGDKAWKLTICDGQRAPARFTIAAGAQCAVLQCIAKSKVRCGLPPDAPVYSCYEAGRDGWWLHRWLKEQGIHNIVVDSSSIEVNRRSRRAKSDRLDGDKLLAMLLRYYRGDTRVWSLLQEPSPQAEDERRLHRELQRLVRERTAHTNRIRALLVLHNLRPAHVGDRAWLQWWPAHQAQLLPQLRWEIERELQRLDLVKQQIHTIEAQRTHELAQQRHPLVSRLIQLRAIGVCSAWTLVKEVFGWRRFGNRRQLAGSLGLTPTPYSSGDSHVEQGISKAGNKRVRALLVELAWRWLRLQPHSQLSRWFNQRFAHGSKRMRRIGIVALARRLAIALWRFVEHGEIPADAMLKPISA